MFGIVLEKFNSELLVLEDLQLPKLSAGQVLVKVSYSGICGSQLMEIQGKRNNSKYLPNLLGHEAIGIVVDVGQGVKKTKVGDQVLVSWIRGKGISSEPPKYFSPKIGVVNAGQCATWSEYSVISENCIFQFEKQIEPRDCFYGCLIPTTLGLIFNHTQIFKGKSILINGLGGLGVMFFYLALDFPFSMIHVNDLNQDRINHVLEIADKNHLGRKVKMFKSNDSIEIAFEFSGSIRGIEYSFENLNKENSKLYLSSHPESGKKIELDPYDFILGKNIFGNWGGGLKLDEDLHKICEYYSSFNFANRLYPSEIFNFYDVNYAIEGMKSHKFLRPILKF